MATSQRSQRQGALASAIEGACKGNPLLRDILTNILKWQDNLTVISGIDPSVSIQSINRNTLAPPPQVKSLDVIGTLGRFIVDVTPENGQTGTLFYLFQSSQTTPFDTSTSLVEYGPSPNTHLDVTQPDETRYWRVMTRYANSQYTSAYYYSGSVSSGSPIETGFSPIITRGFLFTPSDIITDGFAHV